MAHGVYVYWYCVLWYVHVGVCRAGLDVALSCSAVSTIKAGFTRRLYRVTTDQTTLQFHRLLLSVLKIFVFPLT